MNIFDNFEFELSFIDFDNPEFEKRGKVQDWRNYVPDEFKAAWGELTEREKKIIGVMGQAQADKEEWD